MPVAGLERFRPNVDRHPEFLRFWALTVAEHQRIASDAVVDSEEPAEPSLRLQRVRFASLGNVMVHGYLLRPERGQPRPLIVHAHGYNHRYEVMLDWARRGFNVFGFDVRGFGRSAAAAQPCEDGYVLTGIDSPHTSILRGAVVDYLQAARIAKKLLAGRFTTLTFYGFSFGGALALMAGALSRDPDLIVLGQPTFAWNDERRRVALAGSTREVNAYVTKHPQRRDQLRETLGYFDTLHFAPLLRAPALVGIGLDDDVVPSRTVLALVNYFTAPVEVRLLPVSHSADPRESLWRGFEEEWFAYAEAGVPDDFGVAGRQVRGLVT